MRLDPATLPEHDAYKILIGSILPRPIAWVSTINCEGSGSNLAPFSFFMGVCARPLTLAFAPGFKSDGREKDTLLNIRKNKEFVVNLVSEPLAKRMNQTAADFPYGVSEFEEAGLTEAPSVIVKAPRVLESPLSLECKLHTILDVGATPGGGSLVVGTVVQFHCDNDIIDSHYHIDLHKLKPVGRLSGASYIRAYENTFDLQRPLISNTNKRK